jgi:lysozyme family protein
MANYELALKALFDREGLYSKDPDDAGGETYRGISRRYFGDWSGWELIDKEGNAAHRAVLDGLASAHYRTHYWNRIRGDELPEEVGKPLLLASVLTNTGKAVEWLQRSLNAMNAGGTRYPDVQIDGAVADKTQAAIMGAKIAGVLPDVMTAFRALQTIYYMSRIEARPENEKYARGWMKRAQEV